MHKENTDRSSFKDYRRNYSIYSISLQTSQIIIIKKRKEDPLEFSFYNITMLLPSTNYASMISSYCLEFPI